MNIQDLLELLTYLGLTKETVVPLLIFFFIFHLLTSRSFEKIQEEINKMKRAIVEVQTIFRTKWKLILDQTIDKYGQAASPVVLKDEFKSFITKSGLDKQVKKKENELIDWLRKQDPATGIDAQDKIGNLVSSGEIDNYLNLTSYKKYLYEHGKTSGDVVGILAVYLFGVLIPKVIKKDEI